MGVASLCLITLSASQQEEPSPFKKMYVQSKEEL